MGIESLSYTLCALAFTGLAGLFVANRSGYWPQTFFTFAAVTTAIWAGAQAAIIPPATQSAAVALAAAEALRNAGWFTVILILIAIHRGDGKRPWRAFLRRWLGALTGIIVALLALQVSSALLPGSAPAQPQLLGMDMLYADRLLLAVAGLLLVENLYRNAHHDDRWALKFLVLGLAGVFGFDVVLYADAVLHRALDADLEAARGMINALVVPLIAISAKRSPGWAPTVHVSRAVAFHSATLLGCGVYLILVSAAGYYVRDIGGSWGGVIQTSLLFGAALFLGVIVISGRFRAAVKRFVSANFYSYTYDYRYEWLRFMSRLGDEGELPLGERVVRAVADVFEVPEGQLWLRQGDAYSLHMTWNMPPTRGTEPLDSPFVMNLEEGGAFVIDEKGLLDGESDTDTRSPILPDWLTSLPRAWLAVPLIHRDRLIGFLILGQSRHPRALSGDDQELLGILARQAASYMGEWVAFEELTEARRFQDFNKRVTFVTHDLKNLSSQLSLMVGNADRLRRNPAFVDDMIETVGESVAKLRTLLEQLKADPARDQTQPHKVPLGVVVNDVLRRHAHDTPVPELEGSAEGLAVMADRARLTAVLRNLVGNAIDAAGPQGQVHLRIDRRGDTAVIEVVDTGPGMDPAFVRTELFRPFRSTKGAGFGIGAYESREFARRAGGSLDVESTPGRGTTMRLSLPLVRDPAFGTEEVVAGQ